MTPDDTHNERIAFMLRAVAERLQAEPLQRIARQIELRAAYRVTVYHHDRRARDCVATLCRTRDEITLTLVYDGLFHLKPIVHPVSPERYEAFTLALQKLHFDTLKDQPRLPQYGLDFWLVERAAGTFTKSVIVAPAIAEGVYKVLVSIIQTYLPETQREVH